MYFSVGTTRSELRKSRAIMTVRPIEKHYMWGPEKKDFV